MIAKGALTATACGSRTWLSSPRRDAASPCRTRGLTHEAVPTLLGDDDSLSATACCRPLGDPTPLPTENGWTIPGGDLTTAVSAHREVEWLLRRQDSNLNSQNQNLMCCRLHHDGSKVSDRSRC
jgi:hypothetical protein